MRSAANRPITQRPYSSARNDFARISSFDQKPENGGTPAIASQPMIMANDVNGSSLRSPPMIRMSWFSPLPWITEPAPRNSVALKNACVITWKIAAVVRADARARGT